MGVCHGSHRNISQNESSCNRSPQDKRVVFCLEPLHSSGVRLCPLMLVRQFGAAARRPGTAEQGRWSERAQTRKQKKPPQPKRKNRTENEKTVVRSVALVGCTCPATTAATVVSRALAGVFDRASERSETNRMEGAETTSKVPDTQTGAAPSTAAATTPCAPPALLVEGVGPISERGRRSRWRRHRW